MLHPAHKVIIVTERIILDKICDIIDASGAKGYTFVAAGGKGSRNIRSTSEQASVVGDFANVKIEVIVNQRETAVKIVEEIATKYFQNYSGIAYVEETEVLRPEKFE